ncbi:MAG: OmpA family protein [Saccharospirillaceae bacterium]|nr:OmpA family protein [Colwellia sp.]NRB77601.1 OmpA family protein [Saccharospirillaceae bacterium]
MKISIFLSTLISIVMSFFIVLNAFAVCKPFNNNELALNLTQRIYQLQDTVDDCEDIHTIIPFVKELISQNKFSLVQNYLAMAVDYANNDSQKITVAELNAEFYLAQGNVCQVHKLLSKKIKQPYQKEANESIDLSLSDYIQVHGINSDTLTCMLESSRSVSTSRGLTRSNGINMAIKFKKNSSELTEQGVKQVTALSHSIKRLNFERFNINFVGHTDVRGEANYNLTLSKARAYSVYNAVIKQEPSLKALLNYSGQGEAQPITLNDTESAHNTNRRVEIFLSKK